MKLLILRFSSIGDIVLTTPVVRALSKLGHEVHYVTKAKFSAVLENNPYVNKLYTFEKEITEIDNELKSQNYDYIIDLHRNLRTKRLIAKLRVPVKSFNKLNYEKWLKVNLHLDILPPVHIVERYMDTIRFLDIKYDGEGLDYFLSSDDENIFSKIEVSKEEQYVVFVVGGAHATKQIPSDLLAKIAIKSKYKVVLLGSNDDSEKAESINQQASEKCIDLTGKLSLNQSAAVVKFCHKVITADTGLMHIASAFDKNIIAVWGNTIPEFGMYALLPEKTNSTLNNFEVKNLKCRPCSKIGYATCPKKHFHCMLKQDVEAIGNALNN